MLAQSESKEAQAYLQKVLAGKVADLHDRGHISGDRGDTEFMNPSVPKASPAAL